MSPDEIIDALGMIPHPEGGWYVETYRSRGSIPSDALPEAYAGGRSFGTAIFYLLADGAVSSLHRLRSDEVLHHYAGDEVEVTVLAPGGRAEMLRLGVDIGGGARPQHVVHSDSWFGMRVVDDGTALIGATVAPGFDWADFELGDRDALVRAYPGAADAITALTRK